MSKAIQQRENLKREENKSTGQAPSYGNRSQSSRGNNQVKPQNSGPRGVSSPMTLRKNTIQAKSTSKLGTSPMRNSISTRGLNDRQFEQVRELQQAQQELIANQ